MKRSAADLYPMKFRPIRVPKPFWGCPEKKGLGEAWLLSDRPSDPDNHVSVVSNGRLAGRTIHQILETWERDLLGYPLRPARECLRRFPLLIKNLYVCEPFSVQVHPSDRLAAEHAPHDDGKTEAWYVLSDRASGRIFHGLRRGVRPEDLARRLRSAPPEEFLHVLRPKREDVIYVRPGTIHCAHHVSFLEVQQNSDLTFRFHDFGGRPISPQQRRLAVAAVVPGRHGRRLPPPAVRLPNVWSSRLSSPKFQLAELDLAGRLRLEATGTFQVLYVVTGRLKVESRTGKHRSEQGVRKGELILIPASVKQCVLHGPTREHPAPPVRLLRVLPPRTVCKS